MFYIEIFHGSRGDDAVPGNETIVIRVYSLNGKECVAITMINPPCYYGNLVVRYTGKKRKEKEARNEAGGACVACQSWVFTTPRIRKGRLGEIRGFDSIKNQSHRRSIKSTNREEEGAARCSFSSRASSGSSAFLSDGARLVEHKRPFA